MKLPRQHREYIVYMYEMPYPASRVSFDLPRQIGKRKETLRAASRFPIREFKITTTATATGTSLNKRFNEQNNGSARALQLFVHFFPVLCKTTT